MADAPEPKSLEEAQKIIAEQAAELEELRAAPEENQLAKELRETLTLAATAGTIGSPVKYQRLLEMMLGTAAQVIGAEAGAIFVIDRRTDELRFEAAIGPHADAVREKRIPIGEGIAGTVAASGQEVAVADAAEDPRVYRKIGEEIGYFPNSILCVPLIMQDHVIGSMELLDKTGDGNFTPGDMQLLGSFANAAGVAIELGRTYRHIGPLLSDVLQSAGGAAVGRAEALRQRSMTFAIRIEQEPTYLATLELATLVQEIAWEGEEERDAIIGILNAFARYLRERPDPFRDAGVL